MNPFKLLKRSRTLSSGSWSPFIWAGSGRPLHNSTQITPRQALVNSDVFAVVNRVSSDVAGCTVEAPMYQQLFKKPWGNLLTRYSLLQSITVQMMIRGNAYVWIHRKGGKITGLEPIPFDNVVVNRNDEGTDVTYTISLPDSNRKQQVVVSSDDMLHFNLFLSGEADTQYMGTSPLDALVDELNLQDQANKLSLASIIHSLAPTYTLTIPQGKLNSTAKENIRKSFEAQTSGDNAGRAIVLDQSATLDELKGSSDLSPLLDDAKYIQTQIAKAFCIPDEYLNGQGDQQSSTDQIRSLYQNSLTLYIQPIEAEFTSKLGFPVHLDVTNAVDIDHQGLIDNMATLTSDGVLSANAAQQILIDRGAFPELTQIDDRIPSDTTAEGSEDDGQSNRLPNA